MKKQTTQINQQVEKKVRMDKLMKIEMDWKRWVHPNISSKFISVQGLQILLNCVVPENIQTPTTEGIENSRGVGGSEAQEIPEGRGVGP